MNDLVDKSKFFKHMSDEMFDTWIHGWEFDVFQSFCSLCSKLINGGPMFLE